MWPWQRSTISPYGGLWRGPATRVCRLPLESSEVRVAWWCQWSLFAVLLGLLILAGWWKVDSQSLEETAERYDAAARRAMSLNESFAAQMKRDGFLLTPDQISAARIDVGFANQLTEKRTFSWTRLLSDLEEAVPSKVSIASIKLNLQESAVVLEGMAQRLQDLNQFVHQLQQHRAFRQAVLSKHEVRHETAGTVGHGVSQSVTDGEAPPRQVVEYSLTVVYRPML